MSLGTVVGLLTVAGIAARGGILFVSRVQRLEADGAPVSPTLVQRGATDRLLRAADETVRVRVRTDRLLALQEQTLDIQRQSLAVQRDSLAVQRQTLKRIESIDNRTGGTVLTPGR